MSRTGRPPKLTQEIQDRIVSAITAGNYLETAAAFAGIHRATLHRWLKRGAETTIGQYREFRDAVERAQAQAEIRDVAIIGQAATKHWQAAAWRLERKFHDRWGRRRVEVSTPEGQPLQFTAVPLTSQKNRLKPPWS